MRRRTTSSRRATSASAASARSRSPTSHDAGDGRRRALRRRIQGGPAEHLALRRLPAARGAARTVARDARARPARRLHAARSAPTAWPSASACGEVWVKNDAANPTHSFKDRVVSVAAARARELGFETLACASTGNLANSVAAHARRARAGRPTSSSRPTSRSRRSSPPASTATNLVEGPRQLRRRQPPVHRAVAASATGRSSTSTCARTTPRAPRRSPTRSPSSSAGRLPDRVVAPIASGSLFTKIAKGFARVARARPHRRATRRS